MTKIGVLTLSLNDNYGGILQAVALNGFLRDRGFDVKLIRKIRSKPGWKGMLTYVFERIPFQNFKNHRHNYLKRKFHRPFIEKYIPAQTVPTRTKQELERVMAQEKFDAVIVGSDQVWRWDYIGVDPFYAAYFLDFVDSRTCRKIAYAASFGKDEWQNPGKAKEIIPLLADFHAVSTRESSGVAVCASFGCNSCKHVVDPTVLVGADFYGRLLMDVQFDANKKIFLSYLLDLSDKRAAIRGLIMEAVGSDLDLIDIGLASKLSVPEWVSSFKVASFIVTDSFHGMVFAILFNVNFVVIGNAKRGLSRFTSLLAELGLQDRLVSDDTEHDQIIILLRQAIDFVAINKRLAEMREYSAEYLLAAIGSEERLGA